MNRKSRLRKSTDFKRVRQSGKSYAHPFVVLIKHPNPGSRSRFGVAAGRSIGNAVARNRAKRRIREVLRLRSASILEGWDIIILARRAIHNASPAELQLACDQLIERAKLAKDPYGR